MSESTSEFEVVQETLSEEMKRAHLLRMKRTYASHYKCLRGAAFCFEGTVVLLASIKAI